MLGKYGTRLVTAAALGTLVVALAGAQESAPDPDAIQKRIGQLRKEYLTLLDQGKKDDDLRSLLRDLNAATSAGDWNRAAELLAKHGGTIGEVAGAGETGTAEEPWPVRPAPGTKEEEQEAAAYTMEKVTYEGIGGLSLGALLYKPTEAQKKAPGIVLAHDGFRGVPLAYRRLAAALAEVGYIVYAPEFRGQGKSEGKVEYGAGEVLDLLGAMEALKAVEGVDANRIGFVGGGHGGLVVLLALARVEGVVCAAVLSAPTDLLRTVRESSLFVRELRVRRVPLDTNDHNTLRQRSPLYYAGGIQVPIMLLHGGGDLMVPVKHAEGYVAVLVARRKEATLRKYPTADHRLASKLKTYHVDLQNFLAERLKPPGWKVYKKGGKKRGARTKRQKNPRGGTRQQRGGQGTDQQQGGQGTDQQQGGRRRRN
jgi:dienelactone hydrolase